MELAPEIGLPGIVRIDVQRKPDTRVHCVRSDGTVIVCVMNEQEQVRAWVLVQTQGLIEDVVIQPAINGNLDDQVYYVVNRTINGQTVRYREKWAQEVNCRGDQQLCMLADSFVSHSGAATNQISAPHLIGQSVVVWADGVDIGTDDTTTTWAQRYTVDNTGTVTLPSAHSSIVVGLPYTAQFHNPLSADNQMSYNDSRKEGTAAAVRAMTDMNNRCPLTSYVLVGFSQGAVIAGDLASDIGNGRGPVDADLVLGVTLIADGRRQPGVGLDVGPNPPGEGAEITLKEVPTLSALGLTMSGERPGGFGALNNRTNQICAPGDLICSAPESAFNIANLPRTLDVLTAGAGQPIHAMYATPQFWNDDGQTATSWTLNWARNVIENAPHPAHG